MEKSNGWKLLGWLVVLALIYLIVFGIVWAWKPIHPVIGMQELDIRIERSIPADIPISAYSQSDKASIPSDIKARIINIENKDKFIDTIKSYQRHEGHGKLIITLSAKKEDGYYKLIKTYLYLPKNKYSNSNQTIVIHEDVYLFKKLTICKRSYFLKIAPNYITYINIKYEEGR